jgi:benzoylsuccinyl-CoA thiolase BbsA subunit
MTQAARELQAALSLDGDAVTREGNGAPHLVGSACGDCGKRVFPPTDVCPDCMSENMRRLALSRRGTLYSWSVVHAAPRGWTLPFVAGYVDLPEGVRVFAHIVGGDPKALAFDMTVETTISVLGNDDEGRALDGFAFAPVVKEGDA